VTFLIFLFAFQVDHPYNTHWTDIFLRNSLLQYFSSSKILKILFFLPIGYSILTLGLVKFGKNWFVLLYPFTFLSLISVWLVESRYYIIPLAFFILFKKQPNKVISWLTVVLYSLVSGYLFFGVRNRLFFL
jgi:hypothetical protein